MTMTQAGFRTLPIRAMSTVAVDAAVPPTTVSWSASDGRLATSVLAAAAPTTRYAPPAPGQRGRLGERNRAGQRQALLLRAQEFAWAVAHPRSVDGLLHSCDRQRVAYFK